MVSRQPKHFQKGDIIFETNAPATHIYVLEKGELGVKYGDNPLVEVGSIVEGESFGESALLIGGKRSATISCESDVSVQSFDADQIKGMFKKWVDGKLMCQCLLIEMINSNEIRRAKILDKDREEPRSAVLTDLVNNAISSIATLAQTVRQPDELRKGWDDNNAFLVTGGHALIKSGENLVEIGTDTCLGASHLILGNPPAESIIVDRITHPLSGWFIPITEQYERLEDLNTGLAAVARGITQDRKVCCN